MNPSLEMDYLHSVWLFSETFLFVRLAFQSDGAWVNHSLPPSQNISHCDWFSCWSWREMELTKSKGEDYKPEAVNLLNKYVLATRFNFSPLSPRVVWAAEPLAPLPRAGLPPRLRPQAGGGAGECSCQWEFIERLLWTQPLPAAGKCAHR